MIPENQNATQAQAQTPDLGDNTGSTLTTEQARENAISVAEGTAIPPVTPPTTPPPETQPTGEGLDAKKLGLAVARLEKQLRDQKAASDKTQEEYSAMLNRLKDPEQRYSLIEEHGGNYQDWTNQLISGTKEQRDPKDIAIDELKNTVQELAGRLDKRDEGEQKQNQTQAIEKARTYASDYLENNKDKYPYLHAMQRGDFIVSEAVRLNAEGTPVVGDEGEAELAASVEKKYIDSIKNDLVALSKLEPFSKLLGELGYSKTAQTVPETELTQRDNRVTQQNQTLTNDLSGEPTSGFDYSSANPQELRDRAIKVAEHNAQAERRNSQQ